MEEFRSGCSILSGVIVGEYVFLAGESGEIYKIEVVCNKEEG
jgi:hypothetical protein